jgi:hypothetical protein
MKKIAFIAVLFLIAAGGSYAKDREPFFPTEEGTMLLLVSKDDSGNPEIYIRTTIGEVTGSDDSISVNYAIRFYDEDRAEISALGVEHTVSIVNGILEMDMGSLVPRVEGLTITGGKIRIPSKLAPGNRIDDVSVTMSFGDLMTVNMASTDEKCLAIEKVTLPVIGRFNAYKLGGTRTMITNNAGVTTTEVETYVKWYVRGIGEVKSITYNVDGKVKSTIELIELVRP